MLPKSQKLTKKEIDIVFSDGSSLHSKNISFRFLFNEEEKEKSSKFAVSISKKEIKKAVLRNRLRRQMYAFFQNNEEKFKKGFMCVFMFKKIKDIEKEEIFNQMMSLLKKSDII